LFFIVLRVLTPILEQLEFSIGMFHTTLTAMAGNVTSAGKKATTKANSNSLKNNYEFQKLVRDVEAEMNMIRIGKDGRSKADRHPKMVKTLQLVSSG
jgi:ATP-dependent DNA helicase MPH1